MADSEGGTWITVNGTHIFVKDGETIEQAIDRSFSSEGDKLAAALERRSAFTSRKESKITLSKQEYGVLRKEVMRKNSAQKGKVKPTNYAYTANNFYVFRTSGGDHFTLIAQFDIETENNKIDEILALFKE